MSNFCAPLSDRYYFIYLCIYLWLCWVFIAVQAFLWLWRAGATLWLRFAGFSPWTEEPGRLQSTGSQSRARLSCQHAHTRCAGFSCGGARALGSPGCSSCNVWARERRLSSCGTWAALLHSMGDLPGPGIKSTSPPFGRWVLYHLATRKAPDTILVAGSLLVNKHKDSCPW